MAAPVPFVHTIGRTSISVMYADITKLATDVIVRSEDLDLSMSGGAAGGIRAAGGEEIFLETQQHGRRTLGDVIVTSAGQLQAKQIFHAVVLDRQDGRADPDIIGRVVARCLTLCADLGMTSIVFPALATGARRVSPEQSASEIIVAILQWIDSGDHDERVRIIQIALDPDRPGDATTRFHLQVRQYLTLADLMRRRGRARAEADLFRPESMRLPPGQEFAALRRELDIGMVESTSADFTATIAPKCAESLADRLAERFSVEPPAPWTESLSTIKVGLEVPPPPPDRRTTRDHAEDLNSWIDEARVRRAELEWLDLREGKSSPEREKQIAFYRAKEEKYEAELNQLKTRARRPLVMSVHGIRTRGAWQKEITPHLNKAGFDHAPLDYGYFNVVRFLWPGSRTRQVKRFVEKYQKAGADCAEGLPSIIAHSLGSYITVRAMTDYGLRFNRMILCGAIVKEDYDWAEVCRLGAVGSVLNDCGRRDIWARFANLAVSDAGPSGFTGFAETAGGKVVNRDHGAFGHSDFFYERNYRTSWIPFLQGRKPEALLKSGSTSTNWRFIGAMVALTAVLVWLITRFLP